MKTGETFDVTIEIKRRSTGDYMRVQAPRSRRAALMKNPMMAEMLKLMDEHAPVQESEADLKKLVAPSAEPPQNNNKENHPLATTKKNAASKPKTATRKQAGRAPSAKTGGGRKTAARKKST